jgi:DNA-directed RNA polymerase omega subunit
MRKPTIDELLKNEGSLYTLTMLAAKRARQIKIVDKERKGPLQMALEEIAHGSVHAKFLKGEVDDERLVEGIRRTAVHVSTEEGLPPSAFDDEDEAKQPRLFPVR